MHYIRRRLHRDALQVVFAALLCCITLCASGWASEAPLRDHWTVAEKDGHAVGLTRSRAWPTADGFHYLIDVTLQIDFAGSGPIRVTQQYEVDTDVGRALQSFQMVTQVNDNRTVQQGKLDTDGLHVSVAGADGKTYSSLWKQEHAVYFEDALFELIATGAQGSAGTLTAHVWDFAQAGVVERTYTIEDGTYEHKGTAVQGIRLTDSKGVYTFVDRTGAICRQEVPHEQIVARFVEVDDIPELESLSIDTLSVQGNRVVDRPFASTTSLLRVSWQDVPFDAFHWEDNRQRLVKHETTPTEEAVWLDLHRDDRDFSGRVTLPVVDSAFVPYLADVDFLTPSSAAVRQMAAEVVGDETDGWAATRKLVDWVFRFIEPAMIPETLTADQVIEKKKGKCAEYAVLFASLARAVGLPTRVVLGERFESNMWIGHLWNEVWLGEWVAVDASHNQVAPDALLLKFVHSDGVMGTQEVRWGLVGKLGITIEDVVVPQAGPADGKSGIQGQTYTNATFRCQVTAPDGWTLVEAEEQGLPMAVLTSPTDSGVQAILLMFSVPMGTRPEQIMTVRVSAMQGMLPGFVPLGTAGQAVGAEDLPAATAAWVFGEGSAQFHQENWMVVEGDTAYLFVFSAPASAWQAAGTHFQAIRDSFLLLR